MHLITKIELIFGHKLSIDSELKPFFTMRLYHDLTLMINKNHAL